jgi:hypothetical protein
MVTAGAVLIYREANKGKRSLLARTRKQAESFLKHQAPKIKREASRLRDAAADHLGDAVDAGKAAYQQAADRVAERLAG